MQIPLMRQLPDEILDLIWEHVPGHTRALVDRSNYKLYHPCLYDMIPPRSRSALHRDLIRHDCSFVIAVILEEQYHSLIKTKNYRYQSMVHSSYLDFLHFWAQQTEASRCSAAIRNRVGEPAFGANRPKNNRTKGIRWTS